MAAALLYSLRPLMSRPTVRVALWIQGDAVTGKAVEEGVRKAVADRDGRAGGMNVSVVAGESLRMTFTRRANGATLDLEGAEGVVASIGVHPDSFVDLGEGGILHLDVLGIGAGSGFYPLADDARIARSAVLWAKAQGARRVVLLQGRSDLRSAGLAESFRTQGLAEGVEVALRMEVVAITPAIVDRVVRSGADFVFHAGEVPAWRMTAELFTEFRNQGFRGPILTVDSSIWRLPIERWPISVEGVHVISALPKPLPSCQREASAGYAAMQIVLDALDRVGMLDRDAVRAAVLADPRLGAQAPKPTVWIVRSGKLEFVGEAP
jgi:hypothetical protein